MKTENAERLTIGEAARAAGVATTTLCYYEREGLLSPTDRSRAGYRLYDDGAVERPEFIRAAQAVEVFRVEEFIAQTTVKTFRVAILPPSAGRRTPPTGTTRAAWPISIHCVARSQACCFDPAWTSAPRKS